MRILSGYLALAACVAVTGSVADAKSARSSRDAMDDDRDRAAFASPEGDSDPEQANDGAKVLTDGRFGRFSISGDVMYGVVGLDGATDVGPLMVTVDDTASSQLVDSFVGYRLAGDEQSLLSFETRCGTRYQRTVVSASVDGEGNAVSPPESIDAGGDAVLGARVFVRPYRRFFVSATGDIGVYGVSNSTWSASADASLRVTSQVLVSLGWRTLAIDRAQVAMTMHGPRAAVEVLF